MFHRSYDYSGMTDNEYLETGRGQYGRHLWRFKKGFSYYYFDLEPKSKKAMTKNQKVEFQRRLLDQIKKHSKRSYRDKIIAEFVINPSSNNPPHIHTAMKNILDLFGKPLHGSGIKRKGLVYNDDKQIIYLISRYNLDNIEAGITAFFYPFRSFLDDLKLANDILNENKLDSSFLNDIGEVDDKIDFNDNFDKYIRWVEDKETNIRLLGEDLYNLKVKFNKMKIQEEFFNSCRLKIKDIYYLYYSVGIITDRKFTILRLEQLEELFRDQLNSISKWITNSPIKIKLPRIPITEGETRTFKDIVRERLRTYKDKYKILEPLYTPIALEVIYKPPIFSNGFYKDLDNIMRLIIPIFNETFNPPPSYLSVYDFEERDMTQELPKSVKYSVMKYEIFEIPRSEDDTEDGFISMGITGGLSCFNSMWDRINKIIREWERQDYFE